MTATCGRQYGVSGVEEDKGSDEPRPSGEPSDRDGGLGMRLQTLSERPRQLPPSAADLHWVKKIDMSSLHERPLYIRTHPWSQ